jgi:hypothetical protein
MSITAIFIAFLLSFVTNPVIKHSGLHRLGLRAQGRWLEGSLASNAPA